MVVRKGMVQSMSESVRSAAAGVAVPLEFAERWTNLLQCPQCGGSLRPVAADRLGCDRCEHPVAFDGGIADFVAGTSSTRLDDIDYDQFYSVNLGASLTLFDGIRRAAGPLWPTTLGDAVELGCGTGGFTMAMLSRMPARRVLLTDVSVKMLEICRKRLAGMSGLRAEALGFATFSGIEDCFRPDAFDTCFGTAVLHHILDLHRITGQIYRLLKPGGRAFFLEPNLRFHRALTRTLASILADWARQGTLPRDDTIPMLCWMAEVHCNVVNSGELDVLVDREDKHLFVGDTFEAMADAAGFGIAGALACGPDPTGEETIQVYMNQCGIGALTMSRLRAAWPEAQQACFGPLEPRDLSPSYLLWLAKTPRRDDLLPVVPDPAIAPDPAAAALPIRLSLTVALRSDAGGLAIDANGWCLAGEPIKSVQLGANGAGGRLPVWRPRIDLIDVADTDGYPPLHAFCAGIEGTIRVAGAPSGGQPVQVIFCVVALDGRLLTPLSFMLTPDGEAGTIEF